MTSENVGRRARCRSLIDDFAAYLAGDSGDDAKTALSLAPLSTQLANDIADRRVEHRQVKGLEEHSRVDPPKEKLIRRIVLVTGKKNETLTRSRPDPRHRPIKHLAAHPRHHHVTNDEIVPSLHDLAQTLDAAPD